MNTLSPGAVFCMHALHNKPIMFIFYNVPYGSSVICTYSKILTCAVLI